jgi:hypothetical protein
MYTMQHVLNTMIQYTTVNIRHEFDKGIMRS